MCFHTQQQHSSNAVAKHFGTKGPVATGVFNGFQHPQLTVITADQPNETALHQWGLLPHWTMDKSIQTYTLNARYETIDEKAAFQSAKRCLIIVDGFFEWQWLDAKGKQKQKYQIGLPKSELFALAGLWDEWRDKTSGEIIRSCSIVTTEAKGIMREIHNTKHRMPLGLCPKDEKKWLQKSTVEPFEKFMATPLDQPNQQKRLF